MRHERLVSISPDHPALPGHFPNHPVVPGVLLLDEVIETLREHCGQYVVVTGLPSVKLSSPLLPGEPLTILVEREANDRATFACRVGFRLVASGSIQFHITDSDRTMKP